MLSNNPLFSVITINKNNSTGLEKTIASVVNQNFKDFEYIIIDGDSNDNSIEVIKKYETKVSYWLTEKDSGIYNAMNKAIKKSAGTFCIFLNSGDYFFDNSVLSTIKKNLRADADLCFGNIEYEVSKKGYTYTNKLNILHFIDGSIPHGASAIKRDLFDRIGLYNEKNIVVSDWEFFIKAIFINKIKYVYIPQVLTIYQEGGISNNDKFANIRQEEREKIFQELLPEYIDLIHEYKKLRLFEMFWMNTFCYYMYTQLRKVKHRLKILFKSNNK